MSDDEITQRFMATNGAIKTLLEVLIGQEIITPRGAAHLLRDQAQLCEEQGYQLTATLLSGFANYAEDPARIAGRHLLNEPPHGNA